MATLQKDILFYSNFCQFSKEVLSRIIKLNAKQRFVLICVELYKARLPPQVTVVPTIMTTEGDIIVEDDIYTYLDGIASTTTNTPRDMFTSSATGFSFLEGDGEGGYGGEDNYGVFGEEQKIYTPEDDGEVQSGLNFEQLQSQRDMDIKKLYTTTGGNQIRT